MFLGIIGITTLTVTGNAQARIIRVRSKESNNDHLRARLTGLLATLAVLAIVAGLPAVLLAIGATPIPDHVPHLGTAMRRRTDHAATTAPWPCAALAVLAWVAWLFLDGDDRSLEVVARLRGLAATHLPGLALPQSAARGLVGAAVLLFVAGPLHRDRTRPQPPPPHPRRPPLTHQDQARHRRSATACRLSRDGHRPRPGRGDAPDAHRHPRRVAVVASPTDHLGDGRRYLEIADLNADTLGGRPGFLLPAPS